MTNLRGLELFVAAVAEGSFSAAARRAGLSPAAVSRHVAALEGSLGVQLLNRTSRSLALTEAGQNYLARVEPILRGLREAGEEAASFQTALRGTLRLHSRVMFGTQVVAPLLPGFRARYPALLIELRLREHEASMVSEEHDIDLRIGRPQDANLMQRRVLASQRVLVASPTYLADAPPLAAPADVAAHRCLTYWLGPEPVVWRFMVEGALREIVVPATCCSNSGEVLRRLAIHGEGLALLDDYSVAEDVASGRLVRVLPGIAASNTGFDRGIFAVWRRANFTPAKIQVFLDYLIGAVRRKDSAPSA
jgi:DNA-binding transcriptional LysR family regulator